MFAQSMPGARLAYVVAKLEGTVKREVCLWDKKRNQIVRRMVDQPAGYMVYFPRGHAIRLNDEQLVFYGLNRDAPMINLSGLMEPNNPITKLLQAEDDDARRGIHHDMRRQVVRLATAKSGAVLMPEQVEKFDAPGTTASEE